MYLRIFFIFFIFNTLKCDFIGNSQQLDTVYDHSFKNYSIQITFTPQIQIPLKSRLILSLKDSFVTDQQLKSARCQPQCHFQSNTLEFENSVISNIVINISSIKQNLKNKNLQWTIRVVKYTNQSHELSNKMQTTIKQHHLQKLSMKFLLSQNKFNELLNLNKNIQSFNQNLFLNLNELQTGNKDKRNCSVKIGNMHISQCQILPNEIILKLSNKYLKNISPFFSQQNKLTESMNLLVFNNNIKTKSIKIDLIKNIQQNATVTINITSKKTSLNKNNSLFDFIIEEPDNRMSFEISCQDCCKTYANESQYCTSCYSEAYLFNNKCVAQCPENMYIDKETNNCEASEILLSNSLVLTQINCSDGSYSQGGTCMSCNSVCATCINATSCSSCITGFYLNSQYQQCYVCPVYCANCTSEDNCVSCVNISGVYLKDNMCYFKCNYNNYYDDGCQTCSPMVWCAACENNNQCAICTTGYVGIDNLCGACPTGCSYCLYEIFSFPCLSCNQGWQYVNNNCVQCLSGYFPYNQKCVAYLTLGNPIPLPFTLFSFLLIVICVFSYIKHKQTLYFIMFFSLNSLIQGIAAFTLLVLVISYNEYQDYLLFPILVCQILAFVLDIVFKAVSFKPARLTLINDNDYSKWLADNKWLNIGIYFLSLINMKAFFFPFSKAFGDKKLSASVQNLDNFDRCKRTLYFHFSVPVLIIAACCQIIYIRYAPSMRYAPYAIAIDCIIVTLLGTLATIAFLTKTYEIRSQFLVPVLDNPTPTISAVTQRISQLSKIPNV